MALNPDDYDPIFTGYGAPTLYYSSASGVQVTSAYEPNLFEVEWVGTATTDPIIQRRVEAKVYVGSTPLLLGTQVKQSIDYNGVIIYRYNFSDMLKTIFESEFYNNITSDQITSTDEKMVMEYYVEFTPFYTDKNGIERQDTTLTSSTYYTANSIIQGTETIKKFSTQNTKVLYNSTKEFLTFAPTNKVIGKNESEQLNFIYLGSEQLELNYQTYDLAGAANTAGTKSLVTITNKYGVITISDTTASSILFDFDNISKVDIWVKDALGTQISEKKTYTLNHNCTDGYRLVWLNSLGGVDKFTFEFDTNKKYVVSDRIRYKDTSSRTPSHEDRLSKTINNDGNYVYKCKSDLKVTDLAYFIDLLNSNEVYYEVEQNKLLPIDIETMEQTETDSENLITVDITFTLSQQHKTRIG